MKRSGRNTGQTSALTSASTRLAITFVLLLGLSGGTIAVQGGGSPVAIGAAVGGGLLVGVALLQYLRWIG